MPARRAAFTLLEMCISLAIGMVLVLLGVPSVAGLVAEQRLHDSFARFEEMANAARQRSFQEQRPYRLVWGKNGIVLEGAKRPEGTARPGAQREEEERLSVAEGEAYDLERTAALVAPAPTEWTFWPDGTCEPVIISYHGKNGRWRARFDALSTHGTFLQSETL